MSIRTQIHLTEEQKIIRRALDGYLDDQADPAPALAATLGAAPDFTVPTRDEWDRG